MLSELLLATAIAAAGSGALNAKKPQEFSLNDAVLILRNNISLFAESMRSLGLASNDFSPSFIEDEKLFTDPQAKERFVYLDFNGNNGSAVLAKKLEMPFFQSAGQIDFPTSEDVFFDREKGFVMASKEGSLVSLLETSQTSYRQKSGTYAGQEAGAEGCGKIIDPVKYVESKYGAGWSYAGNYTPLWQDFHRQDEFSIYEKLGDDGITSYEGNCLLASIYEVLDYYRKSGVLTSLPSNYVNSDPQDDSFYTSLINQRTSKGKLRYSIFKKTIPSIYKTIRNWFRDNDSYTFGPATIAKSTKCISYLDSSYGISLSSKMLYGWDFESDIADSISSRYRMYIWNETYGTYPNHSMSVCGTYRFEKTSGWWIFSHTDYVNLLRVNDNEIEYERYVDLTAYQSQYPNSGSFLEIKWR